MSICVLPRPKVVAEKSGRFILAAAPIVLGPSADEAERAAAVMLSDAVADWAGPDLPVERHGKLAGLSGPRVQMLLLGRDGELSPGIAKLAGRYKKKLGRDGYALRIDRNGVRVAANTSAGLFYAAQTLIQLLGVSRGRVSLPFCEIVDWPDFTYRGVMLDISRFRVPRMESLVNFAFRLAACKINVLQLYVEHTFLCRRHADYSEGASPITAEQLSELDEICRTLHIELQANQNSLGHLHYILKRPQFQKLAEKMPPKGQPINELVMSSQSPWSLRLNDERVYKFLDDVYAEHLPAVRSPLVNLGCDEVYDMGAGRSKKLVERKGKVRAFVDHVTRIAALARKYGKTTMIWDDMIRNHPEVLDMLPADVVPVFWHYNNVPGDSYWTVWGKSKRRHWVAPGVSGWQTIFGRIDKAWDNIHWVIDFARRGGAEGVLNTEWGDYGHFQNLAAAMHGFAVGGELSWNATPMTDKPDFDRRFARAMFNDPTGRMGKLYRLLGGTNHVFASHPMESLPFRVYWEQFPGGKWLTEVKVSEMNKAADLARRARDLACDLREDPPMGVEDALFQEIIAAADQTMLAARKLELAQRVREARAAGKKLPAALKVQLARFAQDWLEQKEQFRRVWLLNNEPAQIDFRLGLYDERAKELKVLR